MNGLISDRDISVVVQGAVLGQQTIDCLNSVRKFLPNSEIILSTWEGSKINHLDFDKVIFNKDPGGIKQVLMNTNNFKRQLISTKNGINEVERKYTIKLRTDFFLESCDFLKYFDLFQKRNEKYLIFTHRVIVLSSYSRFFSDTNYNPPIFFHPSDFFFFGLTEDLKNYFNSVDLPKDEELYSWKCKYPNKSPYPFLCWKFSPEQFLCLGIVRKKFSNIKYDDWSDVNDYDTFLMSEKILFNNFIFLDSDMSGIASGKQNWILRHEYQVPGLINFSVFLEKYKKYCDDSFSLKKDSFIKKERVLKFYVNTNRKKLLKHYKKFTTPLVVFLKWFGEIFSIIFYFCKMIVK